jgi:hypothetical protein
MVKNLINFALKIFLTVQNNEKTPSAQHPWRKAREV